jgi:transcriptional regulator with XRE-family HTH domain
MNDLRGAEQAISWVVANRLRAQRSERDLTLGQLASISQISKGMLSKIENAQASPSLATLGRLAAALDVPVTSFFRGLEEEREAVLVRADQGAEIVRQGTRVGHVYQLLGNLRGVRKYVEPVLCTLTERAEVFPLFQHPGFELLYVLDGAMEYGYGTQRYRLGKGDTLQFEGEVSHGPTALIKLPVRFLSIKFFPNEVE